MKVGLKHRRLKDKLLFTTNESENEKREKKITSDIDEIIDIDVDAVDAEVASTTRDLGGSLRTFITILFIGFSIFQIWANAVGLLISMQHAGMFVAFTMCLIFLTYPAKSKESASEEAKTGIPWYDWVLAVLGLVAGLYIVFRYNSFAQTTMRPIFIDYVMATLAIVLVLEATRRAIGNIMVVLPVIFIMYALVGHLIPGVLGHYGFTVQRFLMRMYMVPEGLFGVTTNVAASYVFIFVLFGAFLAESGIGKFITDLAFAVSGKAMGGPAKVSIVASSLMGTISGSTVANTATTGAFTIPLMKDTGFSPSFAGAVEAAASTGGAIMPPIMGSAAFLMAEFLGVNYLEIVKAALVPAILYFLAIYVTVHMEAKRLNLVGLPADRLPKLKVVLKRAHLMVPLVVIVVFMIRGWTPLFAALVGILSVVLVSQISPDTRMGLKKITKALDSGARSALSVSIACITAGIIVGVVVMTGLGQIITYNILRLSFGKLYIAMALIAVSAIILTMGLPSTAAYIVIATVGAPALVTMGVVPLAAHLFVFYYASLSSVTPPVALSSYTAAGIAGANPMDVAWEGLRLTASGFIIPFFFALQPALLLQLSFGKSILPIATSIIGIISLSLATAGFYESEINWPRRILLIGAALLLIHNKIYTDAVGLVIIVAIVLKNKLGKKKVKEA